MGQYDITAMWSNDMLRNILSSTRSLYVERVNRAINQLETFYGLVLISDRNKTKPSWFISGINGNSINEWSSEQSIKLSPNSYNGYVTPVRSFLNWCFKQKIILNNEGNPVEEDLSSYIKNVKHASRVRSQDQEAYDPIILSAKNVSDMMNILGEGRKAARNRAILAVMIYAGLNTQEVCALTVGNVLDEERGIIHCKRRGDQWCQVPVNEAFYPYLMDYLKTFSQQPDNNDYLFVNDDGGPLRRSTIYKILCPVQKKLGLPCGGRALRIAFANEVARIGGAGMALEAMNVKHLYVSDVINDSTLDVRKTVIDQLSYTHENDNWQDEMDEHSSNFEEVNKAQIVDLTDILIQLDRKLLDVNESLNIAEEELNAWQNDASDQKEKYRLLISIEEEKRNIEAAIKLLKKYSKF